MTLTPTMRQARQGRVAASECAAIVEPGSHPYTTALGVYWRVRDGLERPVSDPLSAAIGDMLEPVAIRALRLAHGVPLHHYRRTWVRGNLAASPDGGNRDLGVLVETKARAYPPDEPVRAHYWQAVAQLAVVDWASAVWLTYLCGSRLVRFVIDRQAVTDDLARLDMAVGSFMALHVRPGVPPAPDLELDPADLVLRFPALPEGVIRADGPVLDLGTEYAQAVAVRKAAESEEKPIRAALVAEIARLGVAQVVGPNWVATVTTDSQERRRMTFRTDEGKPEA